MKKFFQRLRAIFAEPDVTPYEVTVEEPERVPLAELPQRGNGRIVSHTFGAAPGATHVVPLTGIESPTDPSAGLAQVRSIA